MLSLALPFGRCLCGAPACCGMLWGHGDRPIARHPDQKGPPVTTNAPNPAPSSLTRKRYSLTTALCMIIGICIGSGIYFKADNVLIATSGSVPLGVAMFCIASVVIVFGGLTLSVYAARSEEAGGVLAYADTYLPGPLARIFNWNFTILYLPCIAAVLCWVTGVYACMVFGLGDGFATQMAIGVIYLVVCVAWNVLAPVLAGWFQNATTIIKIIPLIAVGVAGVAASVLGVGSAMVSAAPVAGATATAATTSAAGNLAWLAAAAPIAFSFDGWSMSTSIAPELRDARRTLPLALAVAPLVILALYLIYFVGIATVLTPQGVMKAGDASLGLFFARLLGPGASTLPNVIALVSVMGTVNGVVLSLLRMPQALALRGDFPCSKRVAAIDPRTGFPVASAVAGVVMVLVWMAVHALVTSAGLIENGDVSELSVAFNMLLTAVLLGRVLGFRSDEVGVLRGRVAPVIAVVGCIFVAGSALMSPVRLAAVAVFCLVLAVLSAWLSRR